MLTYQRPVATATRNSGWIILWIAGIFGMVPIFTFKKLGGVPKGSSYTETNVVVDKGIYSVVRHSQYLAGILISIGLVLVAPGWLNAVLGVFNIFQYYTGSFGEEKRLISQFGEAYRDYQKKVPRFNILLGIFRRIWDVVGNRKT